MTKKGLRELRRFPRGNTYMAAGVVEDHKKMGCPNVDTVYLQFSRANKPTTLCITPEEALIIVSLLSDVLRRMAKGA